MKSSNIKIGILGGIGPASTFYFYEQLIKIIQSKIHPRDNTDFPQIIINSIPAQEILSYKNLNSADLEDYVNGIKEINIHRPNFIVMICNTIHLYYSVLQKNSKSKILDIKPYVLNKILGMKGKKVCILGTPNTTINKLYPCKDRNFVLPKNEDLFLISKIISEFNLGINKHKNISMFSNLVNKYLTKADIVILGCTELCLLSRIKSKKIINSLDLMVEMTIDELKKYYNIEKKYE